MSILYGIQGIFVLLQLCLVLLLHSNISLDSSHIYNKDWNRYYT